MNKLPPATYLLIIAVVIISFIRNAYAYLDPGTGSFVIQMLIAAIVGALFALKLFWTRVKDFFKRLFGKKTEDTAEAQKAKNPQKDKHIQQ